MTVYVFVYVYVAGEADMIDEDDKGESSWTGMAGSCTSLGATFASVAKGRFVGADLLYIQMQYYPDGTLRWLPNQPSPPMHSWPAPHWTSCSIVSIEMMLYGGVVLSCPLFTQYNDVRLAA